MTTVVQQKVEEIKELVYPISLRYGEKDWDIKSALREFLSNMLDTKATYQITYKNGVALIEDDGEGLPMKSFIFGESTRDNSQIGQFGEGLKMAFITLLRENRKVKVETVGFNVEVLKESSLGADVLKLKFHKNKRKKGTSIYVQCTEKELQEAKNLFLDLNDEVSRVDENIYLPSGKIFIVGLNTTELPNMIFSYNIDDKSMTNRDRNIVDTSKLMSNLVKILENAKNQRFIKQYLTEFTNNPDAYEYQLQFRIKQARLATWKKVMQKEFPKACLSSDLKSDLYASMMGYTVLRNVPTNLVRIFEQLGMQKSYAYASKYKGEGLKQKNKIIYPIGENYVKDWSRTDAIRELIANALDAGEPRITHNGKEARISDSGPGIMKKHFVLGVSQKADTAIGQFGEGLKVGGLVLARTGTPVTIETVGTTYRLLLEHNEEFNMKLFVVEYKKNNRTKGTSIVFECTVQELESTKNRFIQFQGSRQKPILSKDKSLEVYLGKPNELFIQGVKTTKINSIFGYNVRDKAVLNGRDRNNYHAGLFHQHIANFLKYTTNRDVMKIFLTEWKKGTNKIEYEVGFFPNSYESWNKVVKSLYKKACFSSGTYSEEDFIARSAGYEILANVPSSVRNILEQGGIKTSTTVASRYRNKGILLENRIVYPITSDYAKDWTIMKALKELISNALDADEKCSITFKDGEMIISDKGEGLSRQNLLFGSTTKKTDDKKIGMFGEGLKMASLVLARNKRKFRLVTKGFEYTARIERDKLFNADVLVLELKPSRKRIGTDIYIQSTETETNSAKANFLAFNKEYVEVAPNIYDFKSGKSKYKKGFFVNGMFVMSSESIFSYNIKNKGVIGRDRNNVNTDLVKREVEQSWRKCDSKKAIEKLLNMNNYCFESQLTIIPDGSVRKTWSQVIQKVFGKCCFAIGTEHDQVAKDRGYNLIVQTNPALVQILSACGVRPSDQVVTLKGDEKIVQKRFDEKNLSTTGKKRWNKSKKIFQSLYGVNLTKRIEIIEFQSDYKYQENGTVTMGLYNPGTDMIYVNVDVVEGNKNFTFEDLMGTLLHEQQHRETGAHDCTRAFEYGLTMELGRLANMLYKHLD